ncbi:MAG: sugar ABC transporter permease [Synergistaceae bacterium]|jgi:sn-glycerol 3-phosphate transport system permease protein|nr:sugar ABC transporter permease [Synergistaceae bacterium]
MSDMEKVIDASGPSAPPILAAAAAETGKFLRGAARTATPYIMVAPAILTLCVFVVYPILYMIWLSAFRWDMIGPKIYVGFGNFLDLFSNRDFYLVMSNTFRFVFLSVSISILLALFLAVHLKAKTKINALLQGFVFTPYVISMVSVAFIWVWLMNGEYGLMNFLLGKIGAKGLRWLEDADIAMYSMIIVAVWKGVGYNVIILISAMHTIPNQLYEAAALDNTRPLKMFFRITLPMISPTLFFLTLMNIIASFKVFDQVALMTRGGPVNATNTIVFDIYQFGFTFYQLGYASAQGVVLMAVIAVCTAAYFGALSRRVHYGAEI